MTEARERSTSAAPRGVVSWPTWLGLLGVLLGLTLLPWLLLGEAFEQRLTTLVTETVEPATFALVVGGVLALDPLLPTPSSVLNTLAGSRLGIVPGTLVAWLGLNLGAIAAYLLARAIGRPLLDRLTRIDDRERLAWLAERSGARLLVVTRALPVLAEAAVLFVGASGLPWRRFWPSVVAANFGLALTYATLGKLAVAGGWLSIAVVVSIAVPLLAAALARRLWPA